MEIKQYFFVLSQLTGRDVKRKYAKSKLGIIWSVLNPLLSMAVMTLVFSTMFKKNIENYPLYYLTGITVWNMFTEATKSAMESIVDNKQMLIKVKLPKHIFPLSRVFTAFVNMLYSLIAFVILLIFFKFVPSETVICFPSIIALFLIFSIGIGYILSVVYVFFADIKYLYSVFLRLLMFVSALFYPVESLDGLAYKVVNSNPIYWYISSARNVILYGKWIEISQWIKMCVISIVTFAVGILVFKLNENKLVQKI